MIRQLASGSAFLLIVSSVLACFPHARGAEPSAAPDYLGLVRRYADVMIERGRDRYGKESSPLFATALDRKTLEPGQFPKIQGIREHDRVTTGANPMRDQSLYQILYALSQITGEKKYADEADKTLRWFFQHCQSPATGLLAWGEHMGWDFYTEGPIRDIHEFAGPWVLWDRSFLLAPEPCARFARGLWEHQIGDLRTGNFSRHASYSRHGPGTNSQYPRHGGFYILTWAVAYKHTKDPVLLKAIETVLAHFDTRRNPTSGALPCESASRSREKTVWPESTLSLATDLTTGASLVPEELAGKMRALASKLDEVYQKLGHDFSPRGIGFVSGCDSDTLQTFTTGPWTHTALWATRYGASTDAQIAVGSYLRHGQLAEGPAKAGYRKLVLASANRYLESTPDLKQTIYPEVLGSAVFHMLAAHELSGDKSFLERADYFARLAVGSFLDADSPLPRASSQHQHYEAITGADMLMMALLKVWQVKNRPELDLGLVYSDR